MRKVLAQSSTAAAYDTVLHPYRTSTSVTPDVSASSSVAEPAAIGGHPVPPPSTSALLRYSNRPTFGISLSELKAAIALRAEHYQGSIDETDRYSWLHSLLGFPVSLKSKGV